MSTPRIYYQSERVTLYHGDCLQVLPTLSGVDAVVTDPPYGIGYSSGHGSSEWGDGAIEGDGDTSVRDRTLEMCGGVSAIVFGSWKRQSPNGTRAMLIWDTLGALGMGDLRLPWKPAHQQIYILGNPLGFCGDRGTDVLRFPPVQSMAQNGRVHPFQKPVDLLVELLQHVRGRTVLDPFMGSGTTGVAAVLLGRKFIGIEIDEGYCVIAKRRIIEAEQAFALFDPPKPETQAEMFAASTEAPR